MIGNLNQANADHTRMIEAQNAHRAREVNAAAEYEKLDASGQLLADAFSKEYLAGRVVKLRRRVTELETELAQLRAPKESRAATPLSAQALTVLAHLAKGHTLSPGEARAVFQVERLAARVRELREHGHNVTTAMRQDARGRRYARYGLAP